MSRERLSPQQFARLEAKLRKGPLAHPDLNPAEGIWSLLKRFMANFAAVGLDGLVRIIKRKLKKIQYRPTRPAAAWPPPA